MAYAPPKLVQISVNSAISQGTLIFNADCIRNNWSAGHSPVPLGELTALLKPLVELGELQRGVHERGKQRREAEKRGDRWKRR